MPLNIARGRPAGSHSIAAAAQRGRSTHVAGQRGRPNEEGAGQSYRGVLALFRALEGTRPADRRLLEDRFAAAFLSPRLRLVVGLSRVPLAGGIVPDVHRPSMAGRADLGRRPHPLHRRRGRRGPPLGSGVSRHTRCWLGSTAFFEVDNPSTSAAKRTIVQAVVSPVPHHVRFVPLDFNPDPLPGAMSAAGYDSRRRTLFIWEGVTNYLTDDAVDGTLGWCAGAAPGSLVVFTYVHRQVLDARRRSTERRSSSQRSARRERRGRLA